MLVQLMEADRSLPRPGVQEASDWQVGEMRQRQGMQMDHPIDREGAVQVRLEFSPILNRQLKSYQREGAHFMWSCLEQKKLKGSILADEVGLDTQAQAIGLLDMLRTRGKVNKTLILCANNTDSNRWTQQCRKYFGLDVDAIQCAKSKKDTLRKVQAFMNQLKVELLVLSYDCYKDSAQRLQLARVDLLILDEGENGCSLSKAAQSVMRLDYPRTVLISNKIIHKLEALHTWMKLVGLSSGKYEDFKNHYLQPINKAGAHKSQAVQQFIRHVRTFVLRRAKLQVYAHQLPPYLQIQIFFKLTLRQQDRYNKIRSELSGAGRKFVKEAGPIFFTNKDQTCPKLRFIISKILQHEGSKIVLASNSKANLTLVRQELESKGITWFQLNNEKKKKNNANQFSEALYHEDTRVLLLPLESNFSEIRLTSFHQIIIIEPDEDQYHEARAINMIWHPAQKKKVTVYRLFVCSSCEEVILERQGQKSSLEGVIQSELVPADYPQDHNYMVPYQHRCLNYPKEHNQINDYKDHIQECHNDVMHVHALALAQPPPSQQLPPRQPASQTVSAEAIIIPRQSPSQRRNPLNCKQKNPGLRSKSAQRPKQYEQVDFLLFDEASVAAQMPLLNMSQVSSIMRKYGGGWNRKALSWLIPRPQYEHCCQQIQQYYQHPEHVESCKLRKIPSFVLNTEKILRQGLDKLRLVTQMWGTRSIVYQPVSPQMDLEQGPFRPDHLMQALRWGLEKKGRLLLADEGGRDRMEQSLAIAQCFAKEWPLLVICPSSIQLHWYEVLQLVQQNLEEQNIQVYTEGAALKHKKAQVVIVSYQHAQNFISSHHHFDIVIADEAHFLNSRLCSGRLSSFLTTRKRVLLLTSAPPLACPSKLYTLISIICPDAFSSYDQFCSRYCEPTSNNSPSQKSDKQDPLRFKNELFWLIKNWVMLRRTLSDLLIEFGKVRQQLIVPTDQSKVNELGAFLSSKAKQQGHRDTQSLLDQLVSKHRQGRQDSDTMDRVLRLTAQAKLPAVIRYIQDLLVENNSKVAVFWKHQLTRDGIQAMLKRQRTQWVRIDDTIDPYTRRKYTLAFHDSGSPQVALVYETDLPERLQLPPVSTVIFTDLHYQPQVMLSSEQQAYRPRQQGPVNIQYLIGKDTIDDRFYMCLLEYQNKARSLPSSQASLYLQRHEEPPPQARLDDPVRRHGGIGDPPFTQNTDISESQHREVARHSPVIHKRRPKPLKQIVWKPKGDREGGNGDKEEVYVVPQEAQNHLQIWEEKVEVEGELEWPPGRQHESDWQAE